MKKVIVLLALLVQVGCASGPPPVESGDVQLVDFPGAPVWVQRVEVDGVPCIVARVSSGVALSCDWGCP